MKIPLLAISFAMFMNQASAKVLFVDAMATGVADGSNWSDAFTDLQVALNAAKTNDTFYVKQGTYLPSLDSGFVTPGDIHLFGGFAGTEKHFSERTLADLDNNGRVDLWELSHPTILDANGKLHGAKLRWKSTFNGFTVTNATLAGINAQGVSHITQCQVSHNSGKHGGGIYAYNSDDYHYLLINHNWICHNRTENDASGGGAGIWANMKAKIDSNEICHNQTTAGDGGGVYLYGQAGSTNGNSWSKGAILEHNLIHSNSARTGGAVYANGQTQAVGFNTVLNNLAKKGGGLFASCGSYSYYASSINNLVYNNSADSGGGIYSPSCNTGNSPSFLNNTIVANTAIKGAGAYLDGGVLTNNLIWGNTKDQVWITYSTASKTYQYNAQTGPLNRTGIVSNSTVLSSNNTGDASSPHFIAPTLFSGSTTDPLQIAQLMEANWRLSSESKALDVGNTKRVLYSTDLDNAQRVVYLAVDAGAYEHDHRDFVTPSFEDQSFFFGDKYGPLTWSHNGPESLPVTFSGGAGYLQNDTVLLNNTIFTAPVNMSFAGDMLYRPFSVTAQVTVAKAPVTVTVRSLDVFAEIGSYFNSYLFECEGLLGNDKCEDLLRTIDFHSTGARSTSKPGTYEITFDSPERLRNYENYQYIPGTLTRLVGPLITPSQNHEPHSNAPHHEVDLLGRAIPPHE